MIKTKVAFLEGRLFSSQSGIFENISDCSDWLNKSRLSIEAFFQPSKEKKLKSFQKRKKIAFYRGFFQPIKEKKLAGKKPRSSIESRRRLK